MEDELHDSTGDDEPKEIPYQLIKQITNDFDEKRILGSGGFGTVFKGVHENGEEVAVKIIRDMSGFDDKEFQKEFQNLRRLKHQNVVELVGFCNESEEVIAMYEGRQVVAEKKHTALCLEYVKHGSLGKHISDENSGLDWHIRYKIIKGICEGLKYLREGLEFYSVWHLDLKPDNILIDDNMTPKIADFGLSRLFGEENTLKTVNSVGTRGYLPPEYVECQVISKEFDIYSLGVIIVKIMNGRENHANAYDMPEKKYIKHVHDKWRRRLRHVLPHKSLEVYCHQIKRCIEIALKCMKRDRSERPTIQKIVDNLNETEEMIGDLGVQIEQFQGGEYMFPNENIPEIFSQGSGDYRISDMEIPFEFLRGITDGFSDERTLDSAFGTLYKGILPSGEAVVVRRTGVTLDRGTLTGIEHENIVQFFGFCYREKQRVMKHDGKFIATDVVDCLMCYEYAPMGSLDKHIYGKSHQLDWSTRFKIIMGICQGLHYLHEELDRPVIHMNLKLDNILLDDNMVPKITDFSRAQTQIRTQNVVGTKNNMSSRGLVRKISLNISGRMAPEYLYHGEISTRLDIYSLGILIIEIATGERRKTSAIKFIKKVREKWTEKHIASKYSSLDADFLPQINRCIQTGLRCAARDRNRRPPIGEIIGALLGTGPGSMLHEDIASSTTSRSGVLDSFRRVVSSYKGLLNPQPRLLRFILEPKRLASCSLHLTNDTDDTIAFMLLTNNPRRYLTKLPLCGVVPPECTYSLTVTMREQKKQKPLSNYDDFLTLQSSIVPDQELQNFSPDSMFVFFEKAKETAGDKVKEIKLEVASGPPEETTSNPSIQSAAEIIAISNYRQVLSVDVHPTKPWILTSNHQGNVSIWDYHTKATLHSFEVSADHPVYSAKFIARQKWFVAGDGDGYIYVYNYDTNEEVIESFEAHDSHVMCLAVHPTQTYVLSASDDHKIKLWDWENSAWNCTRTFEGHYNRVTQVIFDPKDNNMFASTSLDRTIKVWDISSATCNMTLDEHQDGVLCLHYYTDDNLQYLISGSSDGAAKIWDLQTESSAGTLEGHTKNIISALCWYPALRVLITGSLDGTVQIWKSTRGTYRLENIIGFNLGAVKSLGYIEESRMIVAGCHQGIAMMQVNLP